MKRTLATALAIVGAATAVTVVAGCGSDSSAEVPTGADMRGTWIQSGSGYEQGKPVTWSNQILVVEEAEGQGFTGYKEYTPEGKPTQRETINGAIAPNGDILITDEDGHIEGTLSNGMLSGQYAEIGDDAAAVNVELTKK
jgi:hypothetical protein